MTNCAQCGMEYVEGLPEDEKLHAAYHNTVVNGVRARPLTTDRIIWHEERRRITVIHSASPRTQRVRAQKVASVAGLEIPTVGGLYNAEEPAGEFRTHLFLFHVGQRAVGIMMLQQRASIWRCRWRGEQSPECERVHDGDPMWSVIFVWVLGKHRRSGIARKLLEEASRFFGLAREAIGWYTPFSADGQSLVKRLNPVYFYVAK